MADRFEEAHHLMRLADGDRLALGILAEHPLGPVGPAIFHGQQAVEKAMKAVLSANRLVFPPTHNLLVLAKLFDDAGLALPVSHGDLERLNPYAVTVRYDDREIHTLTKEAAKAIVDAVMNWASDFIGAEPTP